MELKSSEPIEVPFTEIHSVDNTPLNTLNFSFTLWEQYLETGEESLFTSTSTYEEALEQAISLNNADTENEFSYTITLDTTYFNGEYYESREVNLVTLTKQNTLITSFKPCVEAILDSKKRSEILG